MTTMTIGLFAVEKDIEWYSWNQGYEKAMKEDKTMLVFAQATWCHWCKRMLDKTFSNKEIKSLLSENYIAVSIDVDKEETHTYNGVKYEGSELLSTLMDSDKLGIPTSIFVFPKTSKSIKASGFIDATEMKSLLIKYQKDE